MKRNALPVLMAVWLFLSAGNLFAQNTPVARNQIASNTSSEAGRSAQWLSWAQETPMYNMLGFNSTTQFYAMQRFDANDLSTHVGEQLTRVKFFPSYDEDDPTSASYTIIVYTGGYVSGSTFSPGTLMVSQPVSSVTYGQWNIVDLNSPVTISSGQELWIGVYITAYSGYAMAHDDAAAVYNKGNIMYYNGSWGTGDDFFSDITIHNWKIGGYVRSNGNEQYVDLSVGVFDNEVDQNLIDAMTVPAGEAFRPILIFRNENSNYSDGDYADSVIITTYLDTTQLHQHIYNQPLVLGHGIYSEVTELTALQISSLQLRGTTHTFTLRARPATGWIDQNMANNVKTISVTFEDFTDYHTITILNEDSTIIPCCTLQVRDGLNKMLNIYPPNGVSSLHSVLVDGQPVTDYNVINNSLVRYTFTNVTEDHTFQAIYDTSHVNIPEFNADRAVSIYPNPAKDEISISSERNIHNIDIFDMAGRLVLQFQPSSSNVILDIKPLKSGFYFIKITTEKEIFTQKLIKE